MTTNGNLDNERRLVYKNSILLKPKLITDVRKKKLERKKIQTRNYDRNAKELPSLAEGDIVRMKPQAADRKGRWTKARIEEQVNVRSYTVRTEDGRLFRRNRRTIQT